MQSQHELPRYLDALADPKQRRILGLTPTFPQSHPTGSPLIKGRLGREHLSQSAASHKKTILPNLESSL